MSDTYSAAIDRLVADRVTFLAHVPGDIIGIIRRMHPRSYSYELVAEVLEEMNGLADINDRFTRVEAGIRRIMQPDLQELCRIYERKTETPEEWWADQYAYICQEECVRACCIRLHGRDMWRRVVAKYTEEGLGDISDEDE